MFLASFQWADARPTFRLKQGAVAVTPPAPSDARAPAWWATLEWLAGARESVPETSAALRVTFDPRRGLAQTIFVAAPARSEPALRRYLAAYTRLLTIADGSAVLLRSLDAYDRRADDFPGLRCSPATPYRLGGRWLACDFSVGPELDALLAEAAALGVRFGYQVNVRPVAPTAAQRREARRNALDLSLTPGVPPQVAHMQEVLAQGLDEVAVVHDEILGVDSADGAQWLARALRRSFRRRFGAYGFDDPLVDLVEGGHQEALESPAFALRDDDVATLCAQGLAPAAARDRLSWRPAPSLATLVPPLPPEVEEPPPPTAPAPTGPSGGGSARVVAWAPLGGVVRPTSGGPRHPSTPPPAEVRPGVPQDDPRGPYVFISYGRRDFPRVAPALSLVQGDGLTVWYDAAIPVGAEWTRLLEERLARCCVVLLMLTQGAVDSKWVRREVIFADALNKQIVPLALEPVELRHGLNLLLANTQQFTAASDGRAPGLAEVLRKYCDPHRR